ncbi:hypothetical protein VXQ18_00260 [Brucella abortus]|nr:hypothetical protein [Brucella abortus]
MPTSSAGQTYSSGFRLRAFSSPELLKQMAEKPLIMALANPKPEIMPEEAQRARADAMICTGRSDFPNQVNNVLCFPIFSAARLTSAQRSSTRK